MKGILNSQGGQVRQTGHKAKDLCLTGSLIIIWHAGLTNPRTLKIEMAQRAASLSAGPLADLACPVGCLKSQQHTSLPARAPLLSDALKSPLAPGTREDAQQRTTRRLRRYETACTFFRVQSDKNGIPTVDCSFPAPVVDGAVSSVVRCLKVHVQGFARAPRPQQPTIKEESLESSRVERIATRRRKRF